jgi:hypothetical protein
MRERVVRRRSRPREAAAPAAAEADGCSRGPCARMRREVNTLDDAKKLRIAMLERDGVSPAVGVLYDLLEAQRGVVPYMFKTIAHTPELALGIAAFLKPLMAAGALATRVAILQDCDY